MDKEPHSTKATPWERILGERGNAMVRIPPPGTRAQYSLGVAPPACHWSARECYYASPPTLSDGAHRKCRLYPTPAAASNRNPVWPLTAVRLSSAADRWRCGTNSPGRLPDLKSAPAPNTS